MGTLASTYRHRVPWQTTISIERQLSTWPCLSAAACHPRRSAVHTKIVSKARRESLGTVVSAMATTAEPTACLRTTSATVWKTARRSLMTEMLRNSTPNGRMLSKESRRIFGLVHIGFELRRFSSGALSHCIYNDLLSTFG